MLKIRYFEDKKYYLFLQGIMPGTIHLYQGEEAIAAGVCINLGEQNVITSTQRVHGHAIANEAIPAKETTVWSVYTSAIPLAIPSAFWTATCICPKAGRMIWNVVKKRA